MQHCNPRPEVLPVAWQLDGLVVCAPSWKFCLPFSLTVLKMFCEPFLPLNFSSEVLAEAVCGTKREGVRVRQSRVVL